MWSTHRFCFITMKWTSFNNLFKIIYYKILIYLSGNICFKKSKWSNCGIHSMAVPHKLSPRGSEEEINCWPHTLPNTDSAVELADKTVNGIGVPEFPSSSLWYGFDTNKLMWYS